MKTKKAQNIKQSTNILVIILILFFIIITNSYTATLSSKKRSNSIITLTEYYDYECPHCRHMEHIINQLKKVEPNLQVIYRPTPLLNSQSRLIASFALAAKQQGKGQSVHHALMSCPMAPTIWDVRHIVQQYNFNFKKISHDIKQTSITKLLNHNISLAEHYVLQGRITLPTLVFQIKNQPDKTLILRGEQPYALLDAVVKQLNDDYAQTIQNKNRRFN